MNQRLKSVILTKMRDFNCSMITETDAQKHKGICECTNEYVMYWMRLRFKNLKF